MKDNNFAKKIFTILLVIWVLLSIFDVFYNFIKTFSEARHWLPLTDAQKRQEVYGPIYNFIVFVDKHTENKTTILIYSRDDKAYYLGRYLLYPKNIVVVSNKEALTNEIKKGTYKYIALDKYQLILTGYNTVASNSSEIIFRKQ